MGPLPQSINPDSDLILNSSNCCGVLVRLGTLWSCGPQLASVRDITGWCANGNLIYAARFLLLFVENTSPLVLVPLRYLSTRLAASMCPAEGEVTYLARRLVMVAISGHVDMLSHVSDPMIDCMRLVYCC